MKLGGAVSLDAENLQYRKTHYGARAAGSALQR